MNLLTINQIEENLRSKGAKDIHLSHFWRSLLAGRKPEGTSKLQFPKAVKEAIDEIYPVLCSMAVPIESAADSEGSERLVLRLSDGELIESVLLPKDGLCLSTQVGCAVGCLFCMTGKGGLRRQLTDLEILCQLIEARKKRPVKKVVFMGMGEPSHNRRAVLNAVDYMALYSGIGYKEIVVSTVGDARLFKDLEEREIKPALALSLHSVFDEKRRELLPKGASLSVEEILDFCARYAKLASYPIQYQWTLIAGVNDGDDEIEKLISLWDGQYAVLNMIPVNKVEGTGFERPTEEKLLEIRNRLMNGGVLVKYRNSAAQDVEGGCGQLRARVIKINDKL